MAFKKLKFLREVFCFPYCRSEDFIFVYADYIEAVCAEHRKVGDPQKAQYGFEVGLPLVKGSCLFGRVVPSSGGNVDGLPPCKETYRTFFGVLKRQA